MDASKYNKSAILVVGADGIISDINDLAITILGSVAVGDVWSKIFLNVFGEVSYGLYYVLNSKKIIININQINDNSVIFLEDITKIIDLEEAKSKKYRINAMSEMASSIAHQIKTPLSISLMRAEAMLDSPNEDGINSVINNIEEIAKLLDNMLVFARGGEEKIDVVSSRILFDDLAKMCVDQANITYSGSDVQFIGNYRLIKSGMLNIINNSMESFRGCGRVKIKIHGQIKNGLGCFSYNDNAGGVEEGIDIFARNTTSKKNGSGIGMNIVKFIFEAHGGYIKWKGLIDKGIEIKIYIPIERSIGMGIQINKKNGEKHG